MHAADAARAAARSSSRLQMVFQNPYSSLNPRRKIGVADRGRPRAAAPVGRRAAAARRRAARAASGLPATPAHRFPHAVQRRAAPAHRDRARARRRAVGDRARRAALLARRVRAGADREPARRADARRSSVGLLLISHDLAIVRHVADVVAVMYLGMIVERAPTGELWSAPLHPYTEALTRRCRAPTGSASSRGPRRRGARPGPPAGRVPVPPALPVRVRALRGEPPPLARVGPRCRVLAAGRACHSAPGAAAR